MPESVIERAKELVEELSDADITARAREIAACGVPVKQAKATKKPAKLDEVDMAQMSLFDTVKDDDILKELRELDISNVTPLEALNLLYGFQNKIKNRWQGK